MNRRLLILSLPLIIIPLSLASWILVHILAIFGIFLAIAYPVWWLFAPQQTVCFLCRAGINGVKCPFCRRVINKNQGVFPSSLSSVILNGVLVLIFSLVSVGIVYAEGKLLFKLGFPPTPKTVSFIIPSRGQYRLGELISLKIEITGIKTPINAVQADVSFDPIHLEVENISTEDSFANIFIQKEINNESGYFRLTGGLPNPGFFSDHGLFGTVFLKTKTPGVAKIEFLPSSMVLANDGRGTNVLKDLASASYLILPEKISREEEEMQKDVILGTVLGEKSKETQMKFYEDTNVLGVKVEQEIKEGKESNVFKVFLSGLEKFDRFILEQWGRVFKFFRK